MQRRMSSLTLSNKRVCISRYSRFASYIYKGTYSHECIILLLDLILQFFRFVPNKSLSCNETSSDMNQKSRRTDQVTKENRVPCEDPSLQAIQPYHSTDKQVPGENMAPFLRYEIGILHHPHHCLLGIPGWIKDIIEFCQGCGTIILRCRCNDDEEVHEGKCHDGSIAPHDFFCDLGVGQ